MFTLHDKEELQSVWDILDGILTSLEEREHDHRYEAGMLESAMHLIKHLKDDYHPEAPSEG